MSTKAATRSQDEQYILDEWPKLDDGTEWDGTGLLSLLRADHDPFGGLMDVPAFLREIESSINIEIADVPVVSYGANHFVRNISSLLSHVVLAHAVLVRARVFMSRPPLGDILSHASPAGTQTERAIA